MSWHSQNFGLLLHTAYHLVDIEKENKVAAADVEEQCLSFRITHLGSPQTRKFSAMMPIHVEPDGNGHCTRLFLGEQAEPLTGVCSEVTVAPMAF